MLSSTTSISLKFLLLTYKHPFCPDLKFCLNHIQVTAVVSIADQYQPSHILHTFNQTHGHTQLRRDEFPVDIALNSTQTD